MRSWPAPRLPELPGRSTAPLVYDDQERALVELGPAAPGEPVTLYVCGITPYDATHLGHAATYLAFDTLQRVWRDAGFAVRYAQNVTDVDDPLLERASATGEDWRDLAAREVERFRLDMAALAVIPPDAYVAVTEVIDPIAAAVADLVARGLAYPVAEAPGEPADIYFDTAAAEAATAWAAGEESHLDRAGMLRLFGERGGDPGRAGKRDALDALLWRHARPGEPSWPSPVGAGRPGWHIECSVIAARELGAPITVQGGGSDLLFPHHDLGAGTAAALTGRPHARAYVHAGMVAYRGEKMSKSLGNLVLVSALRDAGVDPGAIRLALLARHYRDDWEWTDSALVDAQTRLARWRAAVDSATPPADRPPKATGGGHGGVPAESAPLAAVRAALHVDLDTPAALAVVDAAAQTGTLTSDLVAAVDALLGIRLA